MTTVRELLEELPADEREADAAGIQALGFDLDGDVESLDQAGAARLRQFLLRRRDELKAKVAALREARKKRQGA